MAKSSVLTINDLVFSDDFQIVSMINGKGDFQIDFTDMGIIGSKADSKKYSKFGKTLGYNSCPKGTELIVGGMKILYKKNPILIKTEKFESRFSTFNMPQDKDVKFKIDISGRPCEYTDLLIQFEDKLNLAILFKIIQTTLQIKNVESDEDFIKQYKEIVGDNNDYQEFIDIIHNKKIIVRPHQLDFEVEDSEYAIDLNDGYKTIIAVSNSILKELAKYLKKQKEDTMSTPQAKILRYFLIQPKLDKCSKPLANSFVCQHIISKDRKTGEIKDPKGSNMTKLTVNVQVACKANPKRDYYATRNAKSDVLTIDQLKLKQYKNAAGEDAGCGSPSFEILAVLNPTLDFKYGASWGSIKISWFITQMAFKEKKISKNFLGVGLISTADFEDEDDDKPVVADNVIEEELEEEAY